MVKTTADDVLKWLRETADPAHRAGLQRYGIPVEPALGVPMGDMKRAAKQFAPAHEIIFSLWETEIYEARIMSIHLADPDKFSREDADRWCADFDNWALCDTAAFQLFDRTPYRWEAAADWAQDPREYVRRAGFATLWGLSVHDKAADDTAFLEALDWADAAATDDRDYVKKAVDMALRAIGKRNQRLNTAVCEFARRLSERSDKTAAWIGRHVLTELESDKVRRKLGLL